MAHSDIFRTGAAFKNVVQYIPYKYLKMMVREAKLQSRAKYRRWRKANRYQFAPYHPPEIYCDDWVGWNEFLGYGDEMRSFERTLAKSQGQKLKLRSFWEAVKWSQRAAKENGLTTRKQWLDWCDDQKAKSSFPSDIPKWPQSHYPEFVGTGWTTWLGQRTNSLIVATEKIEPVFAVHNLWGYALNYVTVIKYESVSDLRDKILSSELTIVPRPLRVYKWDDSRMETVRGMFNVYAIPKDNNIWLVPNMNSLLFEIDCELEFAIPPRELSGMIVG